MSRGDNLRKKAGQLGRRERDRFDAVLKSLPKEVRVIYERESEAVKRQTKDWLRYWHARGKAANELSRVEKCKSPIEIVSELLGIDSSVYYKAQTFYMMCEAPGHSFGEIEDLVAPAVRPFTWTHMVQIVAVPPEPGIDPWAPHRELVRLAVEARLSSRALGELIADEYLRQAQSGNEEMAERVVRKEVQALRGASRRALTTIDRSVQRLATVYGDSDLDSDDVASIETVVEMLSELAERSTEAAQRLNKRLPSKQRSRRAGAAAAH